MEARPDPRTNQQGGPDVPVERRAIQQIFAAQAARRPEACALLWDGGSLSYGELDARASRLARRLQEQGIHREDLVGVCIPRSPEVVIASLAILKAGGAYLPLDPEYPRDRLSFMLADSRARVVITDRAHQSLIPGSAVTALLIDEPDGDAEPDASAPRDAGYADLAYVMYTSGSTGQPKGVMIEHRGVTRLVCGADYVSFAESERFLLLAPTAFDASTFEIWGPLLNGGSLAIAPPGRLSLEAIAETIRRHKVTTLWLTAGLFNLMVDENLEGLRPLHQLIAGGDALSAMHCRKVLAALPHCRLVNGYGPTETTTFAVCATLQKMVIERNAVPIGKPINETEVFILDPQFEAVEEGEAGELYIGGAGVARGYLNQPELTAEKFVTPALGVAHGRRLYRSGDCVRRREDGLIEFLGRFDDQVKVAGYRIEPGEVASVIRQFPGIRDAVVIARKDGIRNARLIAYVVGDPAAIDSDALRIFVAEKIPGFMVPQSFVVLPSLPLTSNGKVDRDSLPPASEAGPSGAAPTLLDVDEDTIAAIWRDVLQRDEIGPHDNFFDLGGDSLRLIEVHARLRKQLGIKVPITELFEYPTVDAIARRLHGAESPATSAADDAAARARRQRELLAQRGRTRQ